MSLSVPSSKFPLADAPGDYVELHYAVASFASTRWRASFPGTVTETPAPLL